jgi:hypothetical protein
VNDVERTAPLPGPIEELPLSAFTTAQAEAMLAQALSGVELGGFDREALDFLAARDTRVTVAVASLMRRAWAAGVEDGKSERLDEAVAVAKARQDLRTLALTVLAAAERADAALDAEDADRQDLTESLVTGVRMAVVAALGADRGAETGRLRAVGQDRCPAHRGMAVAAVVESAVTLTASDGELAAGVRAVVAANQAHDAAALAATQATTRLPPAATGAGPTADQRPVAAPADDLVLTAEQADHLVALVAAVDERDGLDRDGRDDAAVGEDAGSVANRLVIAVCVLGIGVLLAVDHGPQVVSGLLWSVPVELGAVAAWWWRRWHGICRACGHRGSAGDPLTTASTLRRPRVHTRHLPNMRASRRNSRRAALAVRDDAAGGAS